MQEHKFIKNLAHALRSLPEAQREDILADYRAHIYEARGRGKSDEAIELALGDVRTLARSFIADYHVNQIYAPREGQKLSSSLYHMARALVVLISILAFNFFFMLWPILAVASLLIGAWFAAVFLICGIVMVNLVLVFDLVGLALTASLTTKLAFASYSMAALGFTVLLGALLYALSRLFLVGIMKYIKMNIKVVQPQ